MKTEKFFEIFTDLDDDLIENAFPKAQEPEIVHPAERIRLWKPFTAAAAAVVAIVCGIAVGMKLYSSNRNAIAPADSVSEDDKSQAGNIASSNAAANSPVNYAYIMIDEVDYPSNWELVAAADIIAAGKVTNISFELHDQHTGKLVTEYSEDARLCTVYDIDISKSYKGGAEKKVKIIMYYGLEGYEVDKQLELVGEHYIPVLYHQPEINIGEEYLFVLSQPIYDHSSMAQLVNICQGVFPISDLTVNDIINCCSTKISVIHNEQSIALTDPESAALAAAVEEAVINDCSPEFELNTILSEQKIKEYGKEGYSVSLKYSTAKELQINETDKPTSVDNVIVLIGEKDEPSYITYSSTVYNSKGKPITNSHTFNLGESSRDSILQIPENRGSVMDAVRKYDEQKTKYEKMLPTDYTDIPQEMTYGIITDIDDLMVSHMKYINDDGKPDVYTDREGEKVVTLDYLNLQNAEIVFEDGSTASEENLTPGTAVLVEYDMIDETYPGYIYCTKIVILN